MMRPVPWGFEKFLTAERIQDTIRNTGRPDFVALSAKINPGNTFPVPALIHWIPTVFNYRLGRDSGERRSHGIIQTHGDYDPFDEWKLEMKTPASGSSSVLRKVSSGVVAAGGGLVFTHISWISDHHFGRGATFFPDTISMMLVQPDGIGVLADEFFRVRRAP
jgi:hypothetical protein